MSERVTLLQTLRDTVLKYSNRGTVGRMKTEHSVFIPATLISEKSEETADFIKAARYINNKKDWNCSVLAEKLAIGTISGIEFVFQFNLETDYDAIVDYLESRL